VLRFFLWLIFIASLFALFGFGYGLVCAVKQDYLAAGYFYLAFYEIFKTIWPVTAVGTLLLLPGIFLSLAVCRVTGSRARAAVAGLATPLAWLIAYLLTALIIQKKTITYFAYFAQVPFDAFDVIKFLFIPFLTFGAPKFRALWSWILIPYATISAAGLLIGLVIQFPFRWVFKKRVIKPIPMKFLAYSGFSILISFAVANLLFGLATPKAKGPNVIFISIDTLRADHVGTYGYERNTTPNIDALGNESIVFENNIVPAPWTLPSHASMLTGHTPMVHGASKMVYSIHDNMFLLQEILKQNGYHTFAITAVVLLSPAYGFSTGFESYYWLPQFVASQLVDLANKAIDETEQPFFFFFHLFDPHWPYAPPDEFRIFGNRKEAEDRKDEMFYKFVKFMINDASDAERREQIDLYDGEIYFTDHELGRFFDHLKQRGLWDNTIIVLTSDHGEEFLEHGFWSHMYFLYQESLRVPLIIKPQSSAGLPAAVRIPNRVGTIDIMPTILNLVGLKPPREIEGRSLLCLIRGECKDRWEDRYISYTSEAGCSRMAELDSEWKYIQGGQCRFADLDLSRPERLFNLESDPKEMRNLIEEKPDVAGQMRKGLDGWLSEIQEKWPVQYQKPKKLPEDMKEKLKALGYVD